MNERDKKVIDTMLELFMEQGPAFKMEDLAKALKISKKTIYKDYGNKEDMIVLVVKASQEAIEKQLHNIMKNDSYDTVEKLIHVTCAFPDTRDIDIYKALKLKDAFPKPYRMFISYIEDNWQLNKKLFETAVSEGRIKDIDHETFRIIALGVSKQVIETNCDDKEELLNRCIRQVFEGLLI